MSEQNKRVLVVDDTPDNIDVIANVLRPHYNVMAAPNGTVALKIAFSDSPPDLILLDVMMPAIDGYQVCRELKSNPTTQHIPVIFVTAKTETVDEEIGFKVGGVDYITKPISPTLLLARVKTHLSLFDQSQLLRALVEERTAEIFETRLEVIRKLGKAAEFKDNETGMHVIRMSYYSKLLAQQIGMDEEWCEVLFQAAPMHDIGKIGIPDAVLLKPGKLDAEEWTEMKRHSEYGAEILGDHPSPIMSMAREVALYHHEKWNGTGYPNGLNGEEIPLSARIVAIADVYDALSSERPYKKAWEESRIIELLESEKGEHFDPKLIPAFFECLPKIREIKVRYRD